MSKYYDVRCLERAVAIRAVYLLWKKGAWKELDEIGLGREIQEPFEDAEDHLPGSRPRTDAQTDVFMAALPFPLQERVRLAADLLVLSYRHIFQDEIKADSYLKGDSYGRPAKASQEPRKAKRGRSRSRFA
ncbi:hypothetical protein [Ktedonobacter robiniae]|uniref:Uncharacterized protein n=1 Tax=Ktedonobacter robiniae TaxID=2778365 RepID=A0ABQ3URX4_9CHLR|nr:hypothetical protein [Ktedonobacter robiniae]GHO55493.1 hypothetical protein KSB_39680 [Ktedonobacter robiniae]